MSIQFSNAVKFFNSIILKELTKNEIKCWIAGGSVRDYFLGIVDTNVDYDLFFPTLEDYEKAKNHMVNNQGKIVWDSDNGTKIKYKKKTFDLVKLTCKSPADTIDKFDFTVSMFAVDSKRVYHGKTSFIDLAKRQLMIHHVTFPASTLWRTFKYHNKGFKICMGETRKLYDIINKHNTTPVLDFASPRGQDIFEVIGNLDDYSFFRGID